MAPLQKDLKILYQKSGNRCAFPGCSKALTFPETSTDGPVAISEAAHIVGRSPEGPRGHYPLPLKERDLYDSLILLCEEHHHIVDAQAQTYTVERLRQIKADHEKRIEEATDRIVFPDGATGISHEYLKETLHSTLLPVLRMPRYVYSVACSYNDSQEREAASQICTPDDREEICPFIIRSGNLYCFQNLRYSQGPFRELVGRRKVNRMLSKDFWDDPDLMNWYLSLLNRALNKLTGRKGLNLDKDHHRYYFMPVEPGKPRIIRYRPLNQASTPRHVVWQPVTQKTSLPKNYWYHQAVSLRFERVSKAHWVLTLRPELHVSKDGQNPLPPDQIGKKVNRELSRMFNYDFLGELQFWRSFLSGNQPRIEMKFGKGQHLLISTTLMQADISWPGIPPEHQRQFRNIYYQENLFSWASLTQLDAEYQTDDERDDQPNDYEEGGDFDIL